MTYVITEIQGVEELFRAEFGTLTEKFTVIDLTREEARASNSRRVANSGVYVWWNPEFNAIKIGKSFDDSRARALKHFRDDTAGRFVKLADHPLTRLFLFNASNPADKHWVAALEIFLEHRLSPAIPARRIG